MSWRLSYSKSITWVFLNTLGQLEIAHFFINTFLPSKHCHLKGLNQDCLDMAISAIFIWLVVSTPLKNISQLGWFFPIYGKIKNGNQTTNQLWTIHHPILTITCGAGILHIKWHDQPSNHWKNVLGVNRKATTFVGPHNPIGDWTRPCHQTHSDHQESRHLLPSSPAALLLRKKVWTCPNWKRDPRIVMGLVDFHKKDCSNPKFFVDPPSESMESMIPSRNGWFHPIPIMNQQEWLGLDSGGSREVCSWDTVSSAQLILCHTQMCWMVEGWVLPYWICSESINYTLNQVQHPDNIPLPSINYQGCWDCGMRILKPPRVNHCHVLWHAWHQEIAALLTFLGVPWCFQWYTSVPSLKTSNFTNLVKSCRIIMSVSHY